MTRFIALVALVFLAAVGVMSAQRMLSPVAEAPHPKWLEIPAGSSLKWVANRLADDGIVHSARAVEWYGRLRGLEDDIRAGRYIVSPSQSTAEILDRLVRGESEPITIKFVEGIWLPEVAHLLADSLSLDYDSLMARATDRDFLAQYGIDAPSVEGHLFPDTYDFEGHETTDEALARLLVAGQALREKWEPTALANGHSWQEILAIASIIESETGVFDERFKVGAVYHRRLKKGMLLQADPTLIYGLGIRGHTLTRTNLNTDGPYNTYRRPGLPPTPIGNPGEAAIEGAVFPDESCTALYFVAKPGGGHTFSNTYEQHIAAVQVWRKR